MKRLILLTFGLAAAALGQSYNGYLDTSWSNCGSLIGWAWDANQPNTPINLDLFDGSTLIETIAANVYRADLVSAGIGNGYHGFSYNTPPSLKNGQNHSIHVKVAGTAFEL